MSELEVVDLYENTSEKKTKTFLEKAQSTMHVQIDFEDTLKDIEWIDKMLETLPYIDNIFRNPNRFIINNEEILKIELSKKVTVDSIKHLSKHTNFIQDVDKKTGDVIPGKLLNVLKEETYDTYENRLIYTLVENMKFFIAKRKDILQSCFNGQKRNIKKLEYKASTKVEDEKVNININLDTALDSNGKETKDKENILNKIEVLEKKMMDVTNSEVYKILDKLKFSLVRPPIRKTNVVLKNVNFQYAVKLWDYLADNFEDKTKTIKDKRNYMEEGKLKKFVDETFLLDYLAISTLDKKEEIEDKEEKKKLNDNLVTMMLTKMINVDETLTEQDLKDMIGQKYAVIKYKNQATLQEIQKIFKKSIDAYLEKIG